MTFWKLTRRVNGLDLEVGGIAAGHGCTYTSLIVVDGTRREWESSSDSVMYTYVVQFNLQEEDGWMLWSDCVCKTSPRSMKLNSSIDL